MNILPILATLLMSTTSALPSVVRGPLNKVTNLTSYPYSSVATNYYRTTENKTIFTPLVFVLDLSDDTAVYDSVNNKIISNAAFRGNFSGIELSLLSTGGAQRSPAFRHTMDFLFTTSGANHILRISNTFVNQGTTINSTVDTVYDPEENYHTFLMEFKYTANGTGSDTVVRWGDKVITIPTSFHTPSNIWETTDAADTGHNAAWRMFSNGSSRSVTSWSSASEPTDFKFADYASAEDSFYSDLADWYYQKGQRDADSSTFIRGFSAIVGILVNFFLLIANLTIFDISIMGILTLGILLVGIIWVLKLIRG